MNIVPQTHWDKGYENFVIQKASDTDPITQLIKKYIPFAKDNQEAFELGCFPARYLSILGQLGYILNGVDTTPEINKLKKSLTELGYKTGKFENKSFEETNSLRYDRCCCFVWIHRAFYELGKCNQYSY